MGELEAFATELEKLPEQSKSQVRVAESKHSLPYDEAQALK